jgi:hypothetical protein
VTVWITAQGIGFRFDPSGGRLDDLAIADSGRQVAPLYRAPWFDGPVAPGTPRHLAKLAGDFFCAPFAKSEGASGMHGWPANGDWQVDRADGGVLQAALAQPVFGARVTKTLELRDGHPFLYQTHRFHGGAGEVTVANHAMIDLPQGGIICTSAKAHWETAPQPQESDPALGRSTLVSPARSTDPRAFPLVTGGTTDLTRYPWADQSEDFCLGVEAPGHRLGWTAVVRQGLGDLYLSLRDARALPMTMLWHSNGGRDYPPWNGRNLGCLGVEEGAAGHMLGVSRAGDLPGPGALTLNPDGQAEVRHVIGAIAWPSEEAVVDVTEVEDRIIVTGDRGTRRDQPFCAGFLGQD